jgi:hydrogenase 3 maturation protease
MSAIATARAPSRTGLSSEAWLDSLSDSIFGGGGEVHIVGIGNPIKRDDALGIELVSKLRRLLGPQPLPGMRIHPPTLTPERLLVRLSSGKRRIVLFDAIEAGKPPGTVVCAKLEDTKFGYFATHNIPLRILPSIRDLDGKVRVIGVQPAEVDVGEGLSNEVNASCEKLVAAIVEMVEARR